MVSLCCDISVFFFDYCGKEKYCERRNIAGIVRKLVEKVLMHEIRLSLIIFMRSQIC